ncbi:MAG: rhodanese-like domain-containing protein [Thermoplasmatales archaeon]|nr:rhodanese-like domain-containing protein [Thermoplasmatales archaeon]
MNEEKQTNSKNKKILVFIIIAIVAISTSATIGFTYFYWIAEDGSNEGPIELVLTSTYSALSPVETYDLINSSEQVIIIDVRSRCPCNWDTEHIGLEDNFRALKRTEPEFSEFFNETSDIIICDNGGTTAIEWCEGLVNHTYGKICLITGGFDSWKNNGLPTLSPEE